MQDFQREIIRHCSQHVLFSMPFSRVSPARAPIAVAAIILPLESDNGK
jgi:hypothetical protein